MRQTTLPKWEAWDNLPLDAIIDDLMGKSFTCPKCGQHHGMHTKQLLVTSDIFETLADHIKNLGLSGTCLVVFDTNTYAVAGDALMKALAPYTPTAYTFVRQDLHADAQAVGRVLIAMSEQPDFIVSCGSGTVTDTVRYSAHMTNTPFVAFGTAPSMDGYASSSTPLIVDGFKITYPGCAPLGIYAHPTILAQAPKKMLAAGYGDIVAKTIALMDWRLAHDIEGEAYCPLIAGLVEKAVSECVDLAPELATGSEAACAHMMQVLALTGIAMQMMGTSRPASGAEHHISHLLEMKDLMHHKSGSLHGDKVGIGTLYALTLYHDLFKDGMPDLKPIMPADVWTNEIKRVYGDLADMAIQINASTPPSGAALEAQTVSLEKAMKAYGYDFVKNTLTLRDLYAKQIKAIGGPIHPSELGYTPQDIYDAIAHGKEVRPKFTLLRLAERYGYLYELAKRYSTLEVDDFTAPPHKANQ